MTIPIITLNWNGIEDTLECMEALTQQSYTDYIVYLVDNGSDKYDVEQLKKHFGTHSKIKLIFNESNLGFTKGNNAILRKVLEENFEYVVLLNNDTTQEKDWLENLVASAKRNQADMVSSKMIDYHNRRRMDNAGHRMLNTAEIIAISHGESVDDYTEMFENFGACAGAALYSVQMLREIGIFDDYFNTGYEDAELGVRANILGYTTIFEPSAVVYHKISSSINKIRDYQYTLSIQIAVWYTYWKLMPWGVILFNLPSMLFKYSLVFIMNIIFWRKQFLQIQVQSFVEVFFKQRHIIFGGRKAFFKKHQPISSWKIIQKQTFFLWFDIWRFWHFVILRKNPYK